MKGFKQNLDKRTKELDARKPSNNPGQAISEQQLAQNQLQAIQNEQRANLLSQKQDSIAGDNTNELLGQAAMIGVSSGTMGVLGKYGLKTPPSVKQYQKRDVNITPNKITINNNTTNNTTTNIQGGSGGGQGGDSATKFKTWLNKVFVSQKEAANKRNLEYEKRESSLARGANRMLKRIEATGREVASTLNPNNIGQTVGNQLKILLMLFGMTFLSKHWTKVLDAISWIGDTAQNIAGFFGIGERGKQIAASGGGFSNSIVKALGGDPKKKKETIFDAIKGLAKEFTELMKLKFDHAMELRGEAIKSIKFPPIDLTNLTGAIGGLGTYLGNILQALVDPKSAMHSSIKNNIKNTGLASSMARSNNWRNKRFAKNTDFGDASVTGSLGGKKNYSLDRNLLDSSGNLNGSAISHISQSQDILGAIHDAKETGRLDTARMASGLQRLQDQVNKRGLVTVSPEFISQFFDNSTLNELSNEKHINTKLYKYVRVKRTQAEKGSEEGAYGFLEGGARAYGGRVLGEKINGFTGGWGGDYVGGQLVGNGAVTQVMNTNLGDGVLEKLPLVGDLMRGVNTAKVVATGAIEGGIKGMMANDYTLKLVPAEDNSYGSAFVNPSTGKPMFAKFYTLDREALNKLASSLGAKDGINSSDESFLNGIRNRLISSGGGLGAMKARYKKKVNKKLEGFETLDIPGQLQSVRDFDNMSAAFDAQEKDATPRLNSALDYTKGVINQGIETFNGAVNTAKDFVETHLSSSESSKYPGGNRSTASGYKDARMYGNPPIPASTMLSFDANLASSEIKKLAQKRLYDANGNPTKPPYPSKSSTTSYKYCAGHVRRAIAAGLRLRELTKTDGTRPTSAKDYVNFLPGFGFKAIPWDKYSPRKGDILVNGPITGHQHGHISLNTGSGWVSDFVQSDMWGGSSFRANKYGTVFRHIRLVSNGIEEDTGAQDGASYSEYNNTGFYEGAKEIRDEDGNIIGYTPGSDQPDNNVSYGYGVLGGTSATMGGSFSTVGVGNSQIVGGNVYTTQDVGAYSLRGYNYKGVKLTAEQQRLRAGKIVEALMAKGLTKEQAAGVVGNLLVESGLGSEHGEIWDVNGYSSGLAMWHDDARGKGLLNDLKNFAKQKGTNWQDFNTQLEFLLYDMGRRGKNGAKDFYQLLSRASSAEEASALFGKYYEVFAGHNDPNGKGRSNYAKRAAYAKGVMGLTKTGETIEGSFSATNSHEYTTLSWDKNKNNPRFTKDGGGAGLAGDSWGVGMKSCWPGSYSVHGSDRWCHMPSHVDYLVKVGCKLIVVYCGLNSLGESKNWEDGMKKTLAAANGTRLYFCLVSDVPASHCHPKIAGYNKYVADFCKANGIGIIDCYSKSQEICGANNSNVGPDGFHLKNYKGLASIILSSISSELAELTGSDDEDFVPSIFQDDPKYAGGYTLPNNYGSLSIPLLSTTTDEEAAAIKSSGIAGNLYVNNPEFRKELDDGGMSFSEFDKQFQKLSDEDKKTYVLKQTAKQLWSKYKDDKELLEELGLDSFQKFLNTFVGLTDSERSQFEKRLRENRGYIEATNEMLHKAKFYYNPAGEANSERKSDDPYFGATQELLERIEAEIRSGDLSGVYTNEAVEKEAQKRLEKYKAEYDKANEAKEKARLEATKGKEAAAKEMKLYKETSGKTAKQLSLTLGEYAEEKGLATYNEETSTYDFVPGGEAKAVTMMVKEGKLSAQGYIDAKGLGGVTTAEEIESGGIAERSLDENGNIRITDDIRNRARSVEAKRKYESENKGKFWDNLSDAEKKKLTEGIKADKVSEDAIKEATTAKDVANALERDLRLGHVSNPDLINKELDDDVTRELEEKGNFNFDNNSSAVQDKVKYLAAKKKYEAAHPGEKWENLSAEKRKELKSEIKSASAEDFEEAKKLAREDAVKVTTQTLDLNAKDATEQLANKLNEMLGKEGESQYDEYERERLKEAFQANGGALREVKATLSDGSVITQVYNQKGELVTALVPNDVKEKRDKNFNEMYKKLGFSSEAAKRRQDQIEKETNVYRSRTEELSKSGIDINKQIAMNTGNVIDKVGELLNMASTGSGIRVNETSGSVSKQPSDTE